MRFLVVSAGLTAGTTLTLAKTAAESLRALGHEVDLLELSEHPLPFAGGPGSFTHAGAEALAARIQASDGLLLASPVYNYDVTAALKNLVELTGKAWTEKVVGFLLAAGGPASYMSVLGLANSLMLDFRCLILPRFVYALSKHHFQDGRVSDPDIQARIDGLAAELVRVAGALKAS